ncbi:penicillin-binding protein 1A [Rubrivirga marina]|uniref:Uncharacterized protein n=1 Tax=Rubrivirga marina TaxID=1196024 RepID=A0A271IXA6_9BACT|nr:transglycosylase domain-containing protein [Rubrivirga marina]PAP75169.1 hypothetical protein BSZ37_01275 [Rubrivirga marina]
MSEPDPKPAAPTPTPSKTSRSLAPTSGWRRALAWVWAKLAAIAVWIWTRLRTSGRRVWTEVRNEENPRSTRVLWAAGGVAGTGGVVAVAVGVLLFGYAILLWPFTPSVSDLRGAREIYPSTVVSADGTTLTRYARRNREWKSLDEISPHVVDALVATEDRRFRSHGGIDLIGWGSVAVGAATGRGLRGASTLTQQLARNLFPDEIGNSASVTRKLKEGITALKIERVYTKDEILELYLNTVPFLYNAHGIEMAARTYFSTSADDLDRLQAATLVGMLKGTSSYNPRRNPERALARRNVVLGQMVRFGDLPEAEAVALRDEPMGLRFERQPMQTSRAPHFTEHVRVWLEDWADDNGYSLYGDGLTIHTTLDWRMQQAAQESARKFGDALQTVADVEWGRSTASVLGSTTAPYYRAASQTAPFERFWTLRRDAANAFIRDTEAYRRAVTAGEAEDTVLERLRGDRAFLDSLRQHKMRLEVAMTAVEPETGHVKVWIGSRDFERSAYDHVARARRQPGSTFKPFLYARALEEGFRPDDTLPDRDVSIEMPDGVVWQPTNASGSASGQEVSLRDGLVYSKNTIAAQLVQEVGARDLARTARRLGVRSELEAVPSLALGTSDVSLLEMTAAYATIAAGGVRHPPVVVTHITDRDGHEVARFEPEAERALDPDVDVALLDMMRGVIDQGTGTQVRTAFAARGDLAGKTGTTQDGADGWFLLMRPDLVTGAWVGFDDPRVTFRSSYWGQGGHNALRVVGDFNRALQSANLVDTGLAFPTPEEADDAGPGLWARFTRWVGDATSDWFEGADVPEDYGPRTPGRPGPDYDEIDDRPPRRDDGRRDDVFAENAEWLDDAWAELDRIDDPFLREAARQVLEGAAREIRRNGWRDGWSDRVERAQERAMARAQREIERGADDALRREGLADVEVFEDSGDTDGGVFADELDDAPGIEMTPLEDAPVAPPPAEPDPRYPGRERVPDADGRIGW